MRPPESERPQGDSSDKRERAGEHRHDRKGSPANCCTGSEDRFAKSNDQEQVATFQHMLCVKGDVLRTQPPPGDWMRPPPADLIDRRSQRPPEQPGIADMQSE